MARLLGADAASGACRRRGGGGRWRSALQRSGRCAAAESHTHAAACMRQKTLSREEVVSCWVLHGMPCLARVVRRFVTG
eukprot:2822983-Rhodomonas_salina.3